MTDHPDGWARILTKRKLHYLEWRPQKVGVTRIAETLCGQWTYEGTPDASPPDFGTHCNACWRALVRERAERREE